MAKMKRRIFSALLSLCMLLAIAPVKVLAAGTPEIPDGFTAGPDNKLIYKIDATSQNIDVRGLFDGDWIGSTYNNYGFQPVVRSGGSIRWDAEDIKSAFDLEVTAKPTFSEDGEAIFLSYTIENLGDTSRTFDFAIAGDIQIGNDDSADVTLLDGGFSMSSSEDVDANGNPASMILYYGDTAGGSAPDNVWIGPYGNWGGNNLFEDQRQNLENHDSAFSVSWLNITLDPGQTVSYSIGSAVGEVATGTYTVSGFVWYDDGDGLQSCGDSGVPGVYVKILDADGRRVAWTKTDADGRYSLDAPEAGTYTVQFYNLPRGTRATPSLVGDDRDIDSDGIKRTVTLPGALMHHDLGLLKQSVRSTRRR